MCGMYSLHNLAKDDSLLSLQAGKASVLPHELVWVVLGLLGGSCGSDGGGVLLLFVCFVFSETSALSIQDALALRSKYLMFIYREVLFTCCADEYFSLLTRDG